MSLLRKNKETRSFPEVTRYLFCGSGITPHVASFEYPHGFKKLCNLLQHHLSFAFHLCRGTVYSGIMAFTSTITFSDEIKASLQPLEPALANLLRTANLHEDVLNALRVEKILDREMLASLDTTEEGLAESAKDAFGVDPEISFPHKKELAKLKKVWNQAKLQLDAKQKVDAVARAHGELVTMLVCDWRSLVTQFKKIRFVNS